MKIKIFFCFLFLAGILLAHVPGYEMTAYETQTSPIIDGNLNSYSGEWDNAGHESFGSTNTIDVYAKEVVTDTGVKLFLGFNIPTESDEIRYDVLWVFVDKLNNDGSTPQPDDLTFMLQRGFTCPAGTDFSQWTPPSDSGCLMCYGNGEYFSCMNPPYPIGAATQEILSESGVRIGWQAEIIIPLEDINNMIGIAYATLDRDPPVYDVWPTGPSSDFSYPYHAGDLYLEGVEPNIIPFPLDAEIGANTPTDHQWYYDQNASDQYNEMLQMEVIASDSEEIQLFNITLVASGTGNDATDINEILIIHDSNNNGRYDSNDPSELVLGTGNYLQDDGKITIELTDAVVSQIDITNILIVYDMNANALADSTYLFYIPTDSGIQGVGMQSNAHYAGPNTQLMSSIKKILSSSQQNVPTTFSLGLDIPDHTYYLDSQDEFNEMLSFKITATDSGTARLFGIKIKGSGTGNEVNGIKKINLVSDEDADGVHDLNEPVLAQGTYAQDNGVINLDLTSPFVIDAASSSYFILSYEMTQNNSQDDTFAVEIQNIEATDPSGYVDFTNLPILSSTKKIATQTTQPPQQCSGTIALSFNPDKIEINNAVTADVSGLSACEGKTTKVSKYSCSGETIGSCTIGSTGDCKFNFNAPPSGGNYIYYACFDINEDGDVGDAGEQSYSYLEVVDLSITTPAECSKNDCGKCQLEEKCTYVGCNWCGNNCQPTPCPKEGCKGSIIASADPNPATALQQVLIKVKGVTNCDGRTVAIMEDSCDGKKIAACTLSGGECFAMLQTTPNEEGKQKYAVCLDKNDDGIYEEAGETNLLTVETVKIGITATNITTNNTNITITDDGDTTIQNTGIQLYLTILFLILVAALLYLLWSHLKKKKER